MVDWLEWLLSFVLKYFCIYTIVWFGVYLESKASNYFYFLLRFRLSTAPQIFSPTVLKKWDQSIALSHNHSGSG